MKDKFKNKNGSLTVYAFACGYIEEKDGAKLFKDGCWHVQGEVDNGWQCFDLLTEARKAFAKMRKILRAAK